MHELGIVEDALEIAFEHARRVDAERIHRVTMRIGAISGVAPDALRFAFDVATRETMAEGSAFEVELVPVRCRCVECESEFAPDGLFYECPDCRTLSGDVLAGREIELTSLEVS